jgi:hypothetical protein
MGYFDRVAVPPPPPRPSAVQLWPDGDGGYALVWQRPLGPADGFVVLRGAAPDALTAVARVPAAVLRWLVPPDEGRYLALACTMGGNQGEPSAVIALPESQESVPPAPPTPPAPEPEHAPYGRCECCDPPRPLVPSDGSLVCPHTAAPHVAIASGATLLVSSLPYGLCRCCDPPQPLIRSGPSVVCLAQPQRRYEPAANGWQPAAEQPQSAALTDPSAIDAALRANSALLGTNGVFVRR